MTHPILKMMILGAFFGGLLGATVRSHVFSLTLPVREPLAHQLPKYPGGISLRFAMVHDVIHERFPKHGEAYYRHRNDLAKRQLSQGPAATRPSDPAWRLMDDLAVGLVHLGEFDQAAAVMRDKLARQQKLAIGGADLYPTYANLGTAIMIGALHKLSVPDKRDSALKELTKSLDWVRKSIKANPQAHFGREVWQVVLGEFLLAVARDPKLLEQYDMIGNTLEGGYRPAAAMRAPTRYARHVREAMANPKLLGNERNDVRHGITTVGVGRDWVQDTKSSQTEPVPFDEPTLGIVGMWRYGGGANVHFALALAETMSQVGQHHIAWSAYERATRLAQAITDAPAAEKLTQYCRSRQQSIEASLPSSELPRLRPAFDADLKAGLDYQAAYQRYEADRIAAGASIDDPHFYDDFVARHGEIASDPQTADYVTFYPSNFLLDAGPPALLGAGLFGLLTALLRNLVRWVNTLSTT